MKKLFAAILFLAAFATGTANAQGLKFGLKAGLNVTDMQLSEDVFDASNRAGWFAGPMLKISLPVVGLGVDVAALYDYRSADVKDASQQEVKVKQQSVNIPIDLRYSIGLGSTANIFFLAGPQIGFNVGDKNFKWTDTSNYALKKSNFSVNVGLGCTLLKHLEVAANYNIACGKTADVTLLGAAAQVAGSALKSKSRNNSWQISLGYYF